MSSLRTLTGSFLFKGLGKKIFRFIRYLSIWQEGRTCRLRQYWWATRFNDGPTCTFQTLHKSAYLLGLLVNNYEIFINFFHISHNLTWYSAIVHFTRIYPICWTYELTKQFMKICVKNCAIDLKKNNLYPELNAISALSARLKFERF